MLELDAVGITCVCVIMPSDGIVVLISLRLVTSSNILWKSSEDVELMIGLCDYV